MSRRLKFISFVFFISFLTVILMSGCSKNKSTNSDSSNNNGGNNNNSYPNLVVISNFAYNPTNITVSLGDTVTWRNDQGVSHTVTSDTGNTLDSPVLSQGQVYQKVFTQPETYPYHCTIHPSMAGSVTVQ